MNRGISIGLAHPLSVMHTEPWGMKVSAVGVKDVVIPEGMQRSMAGQTERERRAKIIAAEEQVTKEELGPDGG